MRSALAGIGLLALAAALVGSAAALVGCDASLDLTGVLGAGTGNLSAERIAEVEPNDTFEGVSPAAAGYATLLDLAGTMSSAADIDIYDLGPAAAGDRVTVSIDNDPSMNLAAALFDEQQRLVLCNDDRYWQTDPRPELAVTLRRDCQHTYLVVSASPLDSQANPGSYTASVLHESGSVPPARPQTVYLNFSGAKAVRLPTRSAVDIPAFDAGRIDKSFAGQTPGMIAAIVADVRQHYSRFNVQVVSSTEAASVPADATVLYFGTYDPNLLGLAESVDEYNADLTQTAIIFTDTFSMFMPLKPTLQQVAVAIANVASHESGHLLGLEHTQQWTDLMDTTSPAQALLVMQAFESAPLYDQVFPVGLQDSPLLLVEGVGPSPYQAASRVDRYGDFANTVMAADSGLSAITEDVPAGFQHASPAAEVLPDSWRLLLYGQGSAQDDVSKDCFAVHTRRSTVR